MFQGTKGVKTIFYINIFTFTLFSLLGLFGVDLVTPLSAWDGIIKTLCLIS